MRAAPTRGAASGRWPADRPLTDAQRRVAVCVAAYVARHGYGPTLAEVADAVGVEALTVRQALRSLRARGVVTWAERDGRALARTLAVCADWVGRL